jgi:uncharacterized membrane protein YphA (DoxX/SURF4 family)
MNAQTDLEEFMQKAVMVARLLFGLVFTVFGLNVFVPFVPAPEMSEAAGSFFGALLGSGYLVPLLGVTELTAGIFLLAGILVPLALTLLAPVVVNIVLFHIFLDPVGMPIAILVLVLEVFLAWAYRDSFRGVLDLRAEPSAG